MPFSHRTFCRELASPSLSEVLVRLRQQDLLVTVAGGASAGDLMSCFWTDVRLSAADDGDPPLRLTCVRADVAGAVQLGEEIADFVADVGELPPSPARARVLGHLGVTRAIVTIEFPAAGGSDHTDEIAAAIQTFFVEAAGGMAQRDGSGFLDEDDEVILAIA